MQSAHRLHVERLRKRPEQLVGRRRTGHRVQRTRTHSGSRLEAAAYRRAGRPRTRSTAGVAVVQVAAQYAVHDELDAAGRHPFGVVGRSAERLAEARVVDESQRRRCDVLTLPSDEHRTTLEHCFAVERATDE